MVTIHLQQLDIPSGQRVLLHNVSWDEFEAILKELGEHRSTRIAFNKGLLEIMAPLPEHEDDKEVISDLLKCFLEELDIELRTLGSTTFKNPLMLKGIEPDQCFYIQNEPAIRGKKRLDLTVDPPLDLALEIDIPSRTHPEIYAALGVPELWQWADGKIHLCQLQNGVYVEVPDSPSLPGWQLHLAISQYLEQSRIEGRNRAVQAFRQWIRSRLHDSPST
ncbi:MAG: Uma2 family endonuclease [Synechococcales cyanobacterium C42_A2020_086]|jgi:Uma2 family endonuclease|nr:Uma2 family endonuclease [Synechococcales cyanobacterium C42_A2020_086]